MGWGTVSHAAFKFIFIFVRKSENRSWRFIVFYLNFDAFFGPKSLENEKKGNSVGKTSVAFKREDSASENFPDWIGFMFVYVSNFSFVRPQY